jgi:hypothetical protein
VSPETAEKGLGALLTFLKDHVGSELFSRLQSNVPGAEGAISAFETEKEPAGGGLLSTVAGMAGKIFGGQGADASKLFASLGQAGLSAGQIQTFLPKALEMLKDHLPADLLERIKGFIPGASAPTGSPVE